MISLKQNLQSEFESKPQSRGQWWGEGEKSQWGRKHGDLYKSSRMDPACFFPALNATVQMMESHLRMGACSVSPPDWAVEDLDLRFAERDSPTNRVAASPLVHPRSINQLSTCTKRIARWITHHISHDWFDRSSIHCDLHFVMFRIQIT